MTPCRHGIKKILLTKTKSTLIEIRKSMLIEIVIALLKQEILRIGPDLVDPIKLFHL
jgi:hypothetical protein